MVDRLQSRVRLCALLTAMAGALATGSANAADRTDVHFPSLDAHHTMIGGALFRPDRQGPQPAVVMMHGCSGLYTRSGRMQTNLAAWFDRFAAWGYVVLAVDAFRPRGFRSMCETGRRPLDEIDDRPFDAYGALTWLAAQSFVRADRIALVGWSNGAMATLAGMDARGPAQFGAPALRFRAAAAFYPGCIRLEQRGDWRPYAKLLVMVGLADDWTMPRPCLRLIAAVRGAGAPAEIVGFEGAYHAFDHPTLRLRERIARNDAWRTSERTVHIGANPAARAESIRRMQAFLAETLRD
jgi:dienelactone hydrolase